MQYPKSTKVTVICTQFLLGQDGMHKYDKHLFLLGVHSFALSRPSLTTSVPKKQKLSATYSSFTVKNTYPATFCCLDENSELSPNARELYALSCNGLGKKHLSLDKDGNRDYVKAELENFFPRLSHANGKFMLFHTVSGGSRKQLIHKIPVAPKGYSTVWLCGQMTSGTACMHAVPFGKLLTNELNVDIHEV